MPQDGFLKKLFRRIGYKLVAIGTPKSQNNSIDYRWGEPASEEEALEFLYARIRTTAEKMEKTHLSIVGEDGYFSNAIKKKVQDELCLNVSCFDTVEKLASTNPKILQKTLICVSLPSAKSAHSVSKDLLANEITCEMPVEYVIIPIHENRDINRSWEHAASHISPLYIGEQQPFQIYDESLTIFEPKTGIRDYMDLLQGINHVHENQIPGDICEFGSYKGHSGYLTRKYLDEINSDRMLYLFDMFESFPSESIGIDHFWNETHEVDFEDVKSKFSGLDKVEFVKGEFSKTLTGSNCHKISLAFVDCDAYRSTKYLIEEIFNKRLSIGGLMIFEDYGHSNLLGNRLAVHEGFRKLRNCFGFFSHFSGCFIACKTG